MWERVQCAKFFSIMLSGWAGSHASLTLMLGSCVETIKIKLSDIPTLYMGDGCQNTFLLTGCSNCSLATVSRTVVSCSFPDATIQHELPGWVILTQHTQKKKSSTVLSQAIACGCSQLSNQKLGVGCFTEEVLEWLNYHRASANSWSKGHRFTRA